MLGLNLKPKPQVLEPMAVTTEEEEFQAEYQRVAKKLGVEIFAIPGKDLENFLREEGIPVYSQAKVEAYMDKKGFWSWFRMRGRDQSRVIPRTDNKNTSMGRANGMYYPNAIPIPVLLTAERIVDKFGDSVGFYVAAIDKHPDLFLGVFHYQTGEFFIVERWDEPGFRG